MKGYYRHKKGKIYRVLYEAKHSETLEAMVVYQAMYGDKQVWVRPKNMFIEPGRFVKITEEEAFSNGSIENKYRFPDIEYTLEMPNLIDENGGFSKSVRTMRTLLINKNIVIKDLDKIKNDDDLEREIIKRIKQYKQGDSVEEIFHLIQLWGGSAGRIIYNFDGGFVWKNIYPHYQKLIDVCLSVSEVNQLTIAQMRSAVCDFNKSVKNIGVSFITKHTRYWLYKTLGFNALPIYDNIMAKYVMRKKTAEIRNLEEYWTIMANIATQMGIDLMPLERQIFKYAYEYSD